MKSIVGLIVGGIFVIVAAFAAMDSFYTVDPREQTLTTRFGLIVNSTSEPGLHFKIPFVESVLRYPKRIKELDVQPVEVLSSDKKRLVVDVYSRYRIPHKGLRTFYTNANLIARAESRMTTYIQSSLREVVAKNLFISAVKDKRNEMMDEIHKGVAAKALRELGVEVVDVKIKRVDLPDANTQAIYNRMAAERKQEAAGIREQGNYEAKVIVRTADKEAIIIESEATKDASITRGDADAEVIKILAVQHEVDPDFFNFYRAQEAYRKSLPGKTFVVSPDNKFFGEFHEPKLLQQNGYSAGGFTE